MERRWKGGRGEEMEGREGRGDGREGGEGRGEGERRGEESEVEREKKRREG